MLCQPDSRQYPSSCLANYLNLWKPREKSAKSFHPTYLTVHTPSPATRPADANSNAWARIAGAITRDPTWTPFTRAHRQGHSRRPRYSATTGLLGQTGCGADDYAVTLMAGPGVSMAFDGAEGVRCRVKGVPRGGHERGHTEKNHTPLFEQQQHGQENRKLHWTC